MVNFMAVRERKHVPFFETMLVYTEHHASHSWGLWTRLVHYLAHLWGRQRNRLVLLTRSGHRWQLSGCCGFAWCPFRSWSPEQDWRHVPACCSMTDEQARRGAGARD